MLQPVTLGYSATIFSLKKSWRGMRQLNLPYLALRKGLNNFACETTFRFSCASRTTGAANFAWGTAVDLRSDRRAWSI